jgi:hypothetical protein
MEPGHLATWVLALSLYLGLIVISHSFVVHAVAPAWRAVGRARAGRGNPIVGESPIRGAVTRTRSGWVDRATTGADDGGR